MTVPDAVRVPRRPFWGDVRFLLGLVLIVASVAGVWFVVTAARHTAPVYAAAHTLVPGEVIAEEDLVVVDVALGSSATAYLAPNDLDDAAVATRTIDKGELIPSSAVGTADDARTTSVVVRSAVEVPTSIGEGSGVEVWVAPRNEDGGYDAPRVLVADATVVGVTRDESMMGGGAASLELVIPRADVAAALEAMAGGAALSVVPASGVRS